MFYSGCLLPQFAVFLLRILYFFFFFFLWRGFSVLLEIWANTLYSQLLTVSNTLLVKAGVPITHSNSFDSQLVFSQKGFWISLFLSILIEVSNNSIFSFKNFNPKLIGYWYWFTWLIIWFSSSSEVIHTIEIWPTECRYTIIYSFF